MKVQATVLLTFQAKSFAEAGAVLDDVLNPGTGTRRCRRRAGRDCEPARRSGGDPTAAPGSDRICAPGPASGDLGERIVVGLAKPLAVSVTPPDGVVTGACATRPASPSCWDHRSWACR